MRSNLNPFPSKVHLVFALAILVFTAVACGPLTTYPPTPTSTAPLATPGQAAPVASLAPSPTTAPTLAPTATPTARPVIVMPTATATEPAPVVIRFAVIGDYGGGGSPEQDVADLVAGWNPDFIVTVGDNNYPDGAAETIDQNVGQFFHSYIYDYQGQYGAGADTQRFFPTLGNHDWNTQKAQPYLDYFNLPGNERYYDFTWGPVHFFALDSDSREPDGVSLSSIQAEWLQQKLAESESPWNLVILHHAPYSSGLHGSTDWMRWPFQEWGADAVLAGHDHTYERLLIDDIPYFVNGVGGGAIYYFVDVLEGSQKRFNADYGAMLVTAEAQKIQFEFYTRNGELIDNYTLNR
jgi:tartrate-resistant acid phosphatase type 5